MQPDTRSDDMLPVLPPELAVVPKPKFSFDSLLPKPQSLSLSQEQVAELAAFEASLVILGPAAGSVLMCPGNQEGLDQEKRCPYAAKCPLLRMKKAPQGSLCPVERTITEERFSNWCREIEKDPTELSESDRVFVSTLTWLDLQEQRCVNILSTGEAARLTQVNVTEAINYVDQNNEQQVLPLTWERVLHVNTQRLGELQEQRRMILKDWMLTPEQKWKIAKAEGKAKGTDLGSKQSQRGDKLRKLDPTFE
jgi:hypothetical protein